MAGSSNHHWTERTPFSSAASGSFFPPGASLRKAPCVRSIEAVVGQLSRPKMTRISAHSPARKQKRKNARVANVHDGEGNGFLRVGLPHANLGAAKLGRRGSIRAELWCKRCQSAHKRAGKGLRLAHQQRRNGRSHGRVIENLMASGEVLAYRRGVNSLVFRPRCKSTQPTHSHQTRLPSWSS